MIRYSNIEIVDLDLQSPNRLLHLHTLRRGRHVPDVPCWLQRVSFSTIRVYFSTIDQFSKNVTKNILRGRRPFRNEFDDCFHTNVNCSYCIDIATSHAVNNLFLYYPKFVKMNYQLIIHDSYALQLSLSLHDAAISVD